MKLMHLFFGLCAGLGAVAAGGCGGLKQPRPLSYIKITPEVSVKYTNPSLRKLMPDKTRINGKMYYVHQAEKGQTLYALSKAYDVTVQQIMESNPELVNGLKEGQSIRIPAAPGDEPAAPVRAAGDEGTAVVVRDMAGRTPGQEVPVSRATEVTRICQLLEQGLLKNNFNVRDRQLFEAVAGKTDRNQGYAELYGKTGVDMIFEITHFNWDRYQVNRYYQGEQEIPFDTRFGALVYDLYGFSIEIKIIMLQNNVVGGTYKYYYTPCDASLGGCLITRLDKTSLTYIPLESDRPEVLTGTMLNFDRNKKDEKLDDRASGREEERYEKYERTIMSVLTNTIIPRIVADIY